MRRFVFVFAFAAALNAETGRDAWLRYERTPDTLKLPDLVVAAGGDPMIAMARKELVRGLTAMSGHPMREADALGEQPAIALDATVQGMPEDGFMINASGKNIFIRASNA